MVERVVTPGMLLGNVRDVNAGSGAYERNGEVFASMVGSVVERPVPVTLSASKGELIANKEFEVRPAAGRRDVVPKVGATVTGRVARVNQRFASVEILVVEKTPVQTSFRGIIRVQDVRATEVDKVEMYRSFRPRDIVVAEVISLGDKHAYFLSTARNELGVIFAKCAISKETMVPISWERMQCPKTETIEHRKVAQVDPTSTA